MKTLIFCTSLLTDESLFRYASWWNYYHKKFPDADFLIANDGPLNNSTLTKLKSMVEFKITNKNFIVFKNKLGRLDHYHWGWLRSFKAALTHGAQQNYDKVVHIESDAIILSDKLIQFINNENSGWKCLFTQKYGFPESAIQIMNKDSFGLINTIPSEEYNFEKIIELTFKFRPIRNFIGDRYGEDGCLPEHKIDYVCQWDWNWYIDQDWIN
jgi:hypothetical protein